jgi:adenylate kinase family enzyme
MDGNYGGTMNLRLRACDTVIFLDLPRLFCIFRALKRSFLYRKTTFPDMAAGCRERITGEFIRWIWDYPKVRRTRILQKLDDLRTSRKVIVLDSRKTVRRFLKYVEKKNQRSS